MRQLVGQHVKVHVNLHKQQLAVTWPVSSGQVSGYCDDILLWDCVFRVQPAGQARCAETGVRAVCAYVTGWVHAVDTGRADEDPGHLERYYSKLSFDPRRDQQFTAPDGSPVTAAMWVLCAGVRAYADLSAPTNRRN